jgi:hypothetical protein
MLANLTVTAGMSTYSKYRRDRQNCLIIPPLHLFDVLPLADSVDRRDYRFHHGDAPGPFLGWALPLLSWGTPPYRGGLGAWNAGRLE